VSLVAGSNRDDDLSDLLARFEILVRIDYLVERKDLITLKGHNIWTTSGVGRALESCSIRSAARRC
jgi:hypothetical protein